MESVLAPVLAGVFGANAGAFVLKDLNLGILGNVVAGALAGALVAVGNLNGPHLATVPVAAAAALAGAAAMSIVGLVINRLH